MPEQIMQPGRTLNDEMGPEASQMMMQPDDDIRIVLLSRLESMTPEELQALDRAIDGQTARILLKLLPELGELINRFVGQEDPRAQQSGALAAI